MDWAEDLLRAELLSRNISEGRLSRLASEREVRNAEIAEQMEMSQFGVMGRAITLFGGGMFAGLVGSLFGQRALYASIALVGLAYGLLLIRLIKHLNKTLPEGPLSFFRVARRVLELFFVLAATVFAALRCAGKV